MHYLPGDLTDPHQQHNTRDLLERFASCSNRDIYNCMAAAETKKDILYSPDIVNLKHTMDYSKKAERSLKNHQTFDSLRPHTSGSEKTNISSIKANVTPAVFNFQVAKKMAQENLEHQPLPDAILDMSFRRLQVQGANNPGKCIFFLINIH